MKTVNATELAIAWAREAEKRKLLELVEKSATKEEAAEAIRCLLKDK
ncbi:MAG: hypothetical protein LBN04_06520 [Oscillospiraceae bacterium]|jgi:hypothetical protein|nr:hypothetical protein [Oscillospiraceae bacterium]